MAKVQNENRRLFLLAYFGDEPISVIKEINGFVLLKHWDGNGERWMVSIFTKESYQKMNPLFKV